MLISKLIDTIIQGDALEILKTFPDEFVDCCITSPPYWGLRDYGVNGQFGLEKTPEEYVAKMVKVFREVKRILKKKGTLWLNLGDSYAGSGQGWGQRPETLTKLQGGNRGSLHCLNEPLVGYHIPGLKPKDLVGIPWRVAFALQADGWYLRQDIIWAKPNPMPESVTDRCTKSHEYIFLLAKSPKYYFDNEAIKETAIHKEDPRAGYGRLHYRGKREGQNGTGQENFVKIVETRNKRSVWTITTKPFKEAHFATFPEDLIKPMILAGCPEFVCKKCGKVRERIIDNSERVNTRPGLNTGNMKSGKETDPNKVLHNSDLSKYRQQIIYKTLGYTDCGCNAGFTGGIVLDPFVGSGTTALVAKNLGRHFIGIELNPEYVKMANKRLNFEMLEFKETKDE